MRNTIKRHEDFIHELDVPSARSAYFIVKIRPTRFPNDARYGLTATKKTFITAVNRNLARRKLRDWIRFNEKLLSSGFDYVFIARLPILTATRTDGRTAMKKALNYLSKEYGKKS